MKDISLTFMLMVLSTVAFVILKLEGMIDWTWFWVFSPVFIYYGGMIIIGLLFMIVAALTIRSNVRKIREPWIFGRNQ